MEYNGKNKYIPKVNLSLRSKKDQNLLGDEVIKTPKNNFLKSVNTYGENKNKRKEINNSINNDFENLELFDKIKRVQNNSRKLNLINIKKNNSLNIENKINEISKETKQYLYNNIDLQKSEYNKILQNQKYINSDYEYNRPEKDSNISNNKSYLIKDNGNLYKNEINENNSIFNQIISRFKKFNENYQKFIKHTTESNMFNYNIKTKSINKSIDITNNKNNNRPKKDEENKNEKSKLIKVNHMKKNKISKIKNNFLINKPINKNNFRNRKEIKRKENTSFNFRLKDKLLISNEFGKDKINNKRNLKNKYSKNKEKNIIHNKNNSTISYLNNKNKTINYIPINFRINSEKREFRTNRIFSKNKIKRQTEYTKVEMIHNPIKINTKNNQIIDKNKSNNKMALISQKDKENIYTKVNNNYTLKKINQEKKKKFNENLYQNTTDIQQKNENSFLYNTNSCLKNIYLKELNTNSEYENTLSNTIHQMQNTYTEKNSERSFKTKEMNKIDSEIKDNKKADYIKINDNQKIKDSFEDNSSFFDKNQNKTQSNIVQKISLYIKPMNSKSKSKNENSRINPSKEKLLYTKKKNIVNITTTHLSKMNKSIEGNKLIFNNNKNNYIRQPILKKIYINDDDKKDFTIDINNININNDYINTQNISDSYCYVIEKKSSLARFKKFYNFYFKIPIKNNCFIQKIRIHDSKNINNKDNGNEITKKGRNQKIDLFKNGKEDIREKNMSNSYSKNINKLNIDNKYENNLIFHSKNLSNNNLTIENKSWRRAITEEKFVLGCSKLNKILSKNLKMNHIFNGLEIDILKPQMKLNSADIINNQKIQSNNLNNDEKENGGSEKKFKINYSIKPFLDSHNLIKNNICYYELKENIDKKEILNESNNHFNFKMIDINNNYLPKSSRTKENYYDINPLKKSKNKKKSNSSNKIKKEKVIEENKTEIIKDKYIYEQINQDIDNYMKFLEKESKENEEKENFEINYIYNWKIIDDLINNGKAKLEDIIEIYIEICKNKDINKIDLPKFNKYIKSIIEYYITDFSRNQIEIVHLNMIELFKTIIGCISDYSDIFLEILGNLLFILLRNKLYFMKDLNSFTEKENETQINIAKIVKYSILASGKCLKQYHNDFKYTKLFNNNEIFVDYVTNQIPELKKK